MNVFIDEQLELERLSALIEVQQRAVDVLRVLEAQCTERYTFMVGRMVALFPEQRPGPSFGHNPGYDWIRTRCSDLLHRSRECNRLLRQACRRLFELRVDFHDFSGARRGMTG